VNALLDNVANKKKMCHIGMWDQQHMLEIYKVSRVVTGSLFVPLKLRFREVDVDVSVLH
jgi:hypothetical protein